MTDHKHLDNEPYKTRINNDTNLEIIVFSKNTFLNPMDDTRNMISCQPKKVFEEANKLIKQYNISRKNIVKLEIRYNDTIISQDSMFFHCSKRFKLADQNIRQCLVRDYDLPFDHFIKIVIQAKK